MIPVFLKVMNLQLVPSLREERFGVFLKASREDATLPVAYVDPAIWVYDSCRGKRRGGKGIERRDSYRRLLFHEHQRRGLVPGWAKLAAPDMSRYSLSPPVPHLHTTSGSHVMPW